MADPSAWTPYLAAAAVLLTALLTVLVIAQSISHRRRLRALSERLLRAQAETDEKNARAFMSREEAQSLLGNLSRQVTMETDETERRHQALFTAMDGRIERLDRAGETRSAQLAGALAQRLSQTDAQVEKLRDTMDQSLNALRQENARQLDQMRQTVDEKLQTTLDKRLAESFRAVSSQLESVSRGLGEMRTLAGGVDDLKKVLTNVKTRGIWGEMQLGALIGQVLIPGQYEENVQVVPESPLRVEYAVVLPGRTGEKVYLPIDSKFPLSTYERLLEENENGGREQIRAARKALEDALVTEGKRISGKYICPPHTTDFAVMFLPVEGLFAEALRIQGLSETLQTRYRVIIAGPTTLSALLNSLQVGFRTLQVEQRSREVWQTLNHLQEDFARFCELLEAARARMRQATESIDRAAAATRTIESRLRSAEALPEPGASSLAGGSPALSPIDQGPAPSAPERKDP